MAADQGNMEGQWNYGTCLLNGTRVPPDHAEGARYLKLAAADAQPDYAKCLLERRSFECEERNAVSDNGS